MAEGSYKQFCPVAMAAEILCSRWTIILLREFISGSTRFNELRKGVPRMSPALLSQRLKELEEAGILTREKSGAAGQAEYRLTRAGRELEPVVMAMGAWGQRWIDKDLMLEELDAQLLMWDMRRNLNPQPLPDRRCVIQFRYPDAPKAMKVWWLVVEPGAGVDLCSVDPGYDVDLYVAADLRTMTAVWMGYEPIRKAIAEGKIILTGDRKLASSIQSWIGLSSLAKVKQAA
ncbi:MAG TPA: helix-turn-helix domain-containing protein [Micropepsaceae bacterium]|nr:helix-turn-helix domain-containing protein [Micropepsaceae bacterium]